MIGVPLPEKFQQSLHVRIVFFNNTLVTIILVHLFDQKGKACLITQRTRVISGTAILDSYIWRGFSNTSKRTPGINHVIYGFGIKRGHPELIHEGAGGAEESGRATCRERGCQYV